MSNLSNKLRRKEQHAAMTERETRRHTLFTQSPAWSHQAQYPQDCVAWLTSALRPKYPLLGFLGKEESYRLSFPFHQLPLPAGQRRPYAEVDPHLAQLAPSLSNAASPHCSQNPGKDWVWSQHVPRRISSCEDVVTAQGMPHTDPRLAICPIHHSDPDPPPT